VDDLIRIPLVTLQSAYFGSPFRGRMTIIDEDGVSILAQAELPEPTLDNLDNQFVSLEFSMGGSRFFIQIDSPTNEGGSDLIYLLRVGRLFGVPQ
jgi:hypothetical protein